MNTYEKETEIAMILAALCAKWKLFPVQEKSKHETTLLSIMCSLGFTHVGIWKNRIGKYVTIKNLHTIWRFQITDKGDIIR